jgi:hypothetical protein
VEFEQLSFLTVIVQFNGDLECLRFGRSDRVRRAHHVQHEGNLSFRILGEDTGDGLSGGLECGGGGIRDSVPAALD